MSTAYSPAATGTSKRGIPGHRHRPPRNAGGGGHHRPVRRWRPVGAPACMWASSWAGQLSRPRFTPWRATDGGLYRDPLPPRRHHSAGDPRQGTALVRAPLHAADMASPALWTATGRGWTSTTAARLIIHGAHRVSAEPGRPVAWRQTAGSSAAGAPVAQHVGDAARRHHHHRRPHPLRQLLREEPAPASPCT